MTNVLKAYSQLTWLSLTGFIYAISSGAMWFILPTFASVKFGADLVFVSLLIALPYVTSLIFDLPTGTLSDYVGRKKVIIIGLALLAPLSLGLAYADSLELFIVFAALFGFFSTFVLPVARALIMDICPPKKAAEYFGIILGLITLGAAVGPLVSGMLLEAPSEGAFLAAFEAGLPTVLLLCAVCSLVAILPLLLIKEPIKVRQPLSSGLKKVAKQGFFLPAIREFGALKRVGFLVIYVTLILTIIDGIIWTFEPLIYEEKGLSASFVGTLMFVFVFSLVIFQAIGGFIAERLGKIRVLAFGLLFGGAFMALFALQTDEMMMMVTAALSSLGVGFAWPAVSEVITEISVNRQRGGIAGVWNFFIDLAYLVSPILGGVIAAFSNNVSSIFLVMGVVLALSSIPLVFMKKK